MLLTMLRGPVHEHIGFGIAAAPVLRHLAGGFVNLNRMGTGKPCLLSVVYQALVSLRTPDDPVGHCRLAQNHIVLLKVLGNAVQRDDVGVLGIHDSSNQRGCGDAVAKHQLQHLTVRIHDLQSSGFAVGRGLA